MFLKFRHDDNGYYVKRNVWLYIIACFAISRFLMVAVHIAITNTISIQSFIADMQQYDAGWYIGYVDAIAQRKFNVYPPLGYANWNFFPLYPLCVYIAHSISGVSVPLMAMSLNSLFFLISEYYTYKYIMLTRHNMKIAKVFIFVMSFGPYSFYCSSSYSEGLFLMLLSLCFYYMKKKDYIKMGIAGGFLSATRSVGIMFVFVILIECITEMLQTKGENWRTVLGKRLSNANLIFGTTLIPAGFFAYSAFLAVKLGDGLAFVHSQEVPWERSVHVGLIHNMIDALINNFPPTYFGVICLVGIILIIYLVLDKHYEEAIFPIIVCVVSMDTFLTAAPRYLFGSLMVILSLSERVCRWTKPSRIMFLGFILIFELVLVREWFLGNWMLM